MERPQFAMTSSTDALQHVATVSASLSLYGSLLLIILLLNRRDGIFLGGSVGRMTTRVLLTLTLAAGTTTESTCEDKHTACASWADAGECTRNPHWMEEHCELSCRRWRRSGESSSGIAGSHQEAEPSDACVDLMKDCEVWSRAGECESNPSFMRVECRLSCGVCCADIIPGCAALTLGGKCTHHFRFLGRYCRKSCGGCSLTGGDVVCADAVAECDQWALDGHCSRLGAVEQTCPLSCGACLPSPNAAAREVPGAAVAAAEADARPSIMFGTAWKKERTGELVEQALRLGFRAVDTANQPKHYYEAGVGEAIEAMRGELSRDDLFLQTKFTPVEAQDPVELPYDGAAPIEVQVAQSVNGSLRHLRTHWVDSLLLHAPLSTHEGTMRAWAAMEREVDAGRVRSLGVSNVPDVGTLARIVAGARVKPRWLQNALWDRSQYDGPLRAFCVAANMGYQAYRLVASNQLAIRSSVMQQLAMTHQLSAEGAWFASVQSVGAVPLTGSTSETHLRVALGGVATHLSAAETIEVQRALDASFKPA